MGLGHDAYNGYVEELRNSEYPQLLATTYLDHAGTTPYACSLIDAYHEDLTSHLYGNPHSFSPASDLSTKRVDQARHAVLRYFHANPDKFDVVFTANASAAVKLVADCFRDQGFDYIYHKDVHTSIVGIRELSRTSQCLATEQEVKDWIERQKSRSSTTLQLFAYPVQSNLNGYRPPYSWSKTIRTACQHPDRPQSTYVLVDAASYLTSGRLDLTSIDDAPDFVALSFYKIFGFPDLGALLIKKTAFNVMTHRRYFGGGTVDTVTVINHAFHGRKRDNLHDFLEDGTLPFHNILALIYAIKIHENLFGSAEAVTQHMSFLINWLYKELKALRHFNGMPVVEIYRDPMAIYGDSSTQGPIIAFNLLRSNGDFVGKSHLERLAIDCGFQLRTGGVCNPGGIASMLHLSHWELMRNFTEGVRCGGDVDIVGAKPTGICRVSLGPMSTMSDLVRFANFVKTFFVESVEKDPLVHRAQVSPNVLEKTIAPIDGCLGYLVDVELYDAHSSWDRKWCIVPEDDSGVVQLRNSLASLTVRADVGSEMLRITHISGDETALSLWELPKTIQVTAPLSKSHHIDIYDHAINDWLSTHLGLACMLGLDSYNSPSQKQEAVTCVVSDCRVNCGDSERLQEHYLAHGNDFMQVYPFTPPRTSRDTQKQNLPNPAAKVPRPAVPVAFDRSVTPIAVTGSDCSIGLSPKPFASTSPSVITDRSSSPNVKTEDFLSEKHVTRSPRSHNRKFSTMLTRLAGRG